MFLSIFLNIEILMVVLGYCRGGVVAYSCLTLAIPWTEEPGRLQSMGSLKVRHD